MARASAPLAGALALWALQALVVTYWTRAYQYADDDTGLAVRLARACLEHGVCPGSGMPTSGLGLSHGASWIRLIGYCLTTDGSLGTLQAIVLALLVASVVVASVVVWNMVSWRAGMVAALLVLPATLATQRFDDLTNGTILPLPLAVFYACAVWSLRSGRLAPALGGSVALAAAMSASLSSMILAPLHLALVASAARRWLATTLVAALAIAATFAVESPRSAAQLARVLVVPAIALLGVLLAVGVAALASRAARTALRRIADVVGSERRRFLAMPVLPRVRAAMKLAALYVLAAGWTASLSHLHVPDAHYFGSAVFPLVFLAADATESMSARSVARLGGVLLIALGSLLFAPLAVAVGSLLSVIAAAVAAAVLLTLLVRALRSGEDAVSTLAARPRAAAAIVATGFVCLMSAPDALLYPRARQLWPVTTAETMVRGLYASGLTFPELMGALQGQAPYTLQSMIASLDPAFARDQPMADAGSRSLLATIVDPTNAARARDVLMRVDTRAGGAALAVRVPSFLDRARLKTCYASSCDEPIDPRRCITRDPRGLVRHDRPYFPFDTLPAVPTVPGASYCVRFFVPVRTPGSGGPQWLRTPEIWPLRVRIRDVTGVSFDGAVPGPEVRLRNDAAATGTVEVEVSAHGIGPESDWLEQPPLLEVDAANEALLEPYRQGRVTLR